MIFDAHGDILTDIEAKSRAGIDVFKQYHLPLYQTADVMGSIFVNYTDPTSATQDQTFENISKVAIPYLQELEYINIVKDDTNFKMGKLNVILGIEGAKPLKNMQQLIDMYNLGYRHIGLTWNERNQFACGADGVGGLTQLGEEVVKWCNQNGMIIDYAHLNFQSFSDVASISTKPILFSHGNVKKLCDHQRNLDDYQLELIKASDGVIGLCAIKPFLTSGPTATIDNLVDHIIYVRNKIGIRHVGLGLDFCYYLDNLPANNVVGLESIDKIVDLKTKLREADFTNSEIDDIFYKNMLRVVKANLKVEENNEI